MSLHNNIQQAESYPINWQEQGGREGVEGTGGLQSHHLRTGVVKEAVRSSRSFPSGVWYSEDMPGMTVLSALQWGRRSYSCALAKCPVRQRDRILNFISFQFIRIST